MNATHPLPVHELQKLGQSPWLDNITRELLNIGTLARYIRDFAVTGLTSNPTIFEQAIGHSTSYDESIRRKSGGESSENVFNIMPAVLGQQLVPAAATSA